MELQEEVNRLRKEFRVLEGWEIFLNDEAQYKGQCVTNVKQKSAVIYGWRGETIPEDYIFHELIHVCLRAIHHKKGFKKQAEEMFVQDICRIVKEKTLNMNYTKDLKGGMSK